MSGTFPSFSAPGKIFLAGEYGVLAGGTAVVAAVDRRATARFVSGGAPATPLVEQVMAAVGAELGAALPEGAPEIDSSPLAGGEGKLGLGSSAAVAAAGVAVLLAAAGVDPEVERQRTLTLADRAHRAAQGGRGSGADVASAVFGGVIAYARHPDGPARIEPLGPSPVEVIVFSAGAPRLTVDGIRALETFAAHAPEQHRLRMEQIAAAADRFAGAWRAADAASVVAAARGAGTALGDLGREANIEIWTDPVRSAAALAHDLGGTAKPSGAGGGDVGVAFLPDGRAAERFRAAASALQVRILAIQIAAPGLSRVP